MRRVVRLTFGIAVLAALGVAIERSMTVPSVALKAPTPPPVPVVTAMVAQSDVPVILTGLGTVRALNTAIIRSQVTGLLQSVDFVEGQPVERGRLLAQIDPRPQQARLDQALAQLARDQEQLANLRINLGRNIPLLKGGFATEELVTNQKSQVVQMENVIKSDEASVEDARTQLSYTSLVAPFDGVTGVRALDVGNIIHPTDANGLVTVTQVQPISVLFTLPAKDIPQVADALASGTVEAVAFDKSGARELDTGQLVLINNQADPASGTVQLKAVFPNQRKSLWPGVFVNIELTLRTVRGGLTVPTDAVQQGDGGAFVFVVGPEGKVAPRAVEVSQRHRGSALASRGLQPGETVVTQGQYRLVEGTFVTPVKPEQADNLSAASSGLLP